MTTINSYIENCLISEYVDKHDPHGYSLSLNDLPKQEVENFLDFLLKHDLALRDIIYDHMQDLIDNRLPFAEAQDLTSQGYVPSQDRTNGEISWIRGAA